MAFDSLAYAVIQMIHNLSATVALGAPLFGLWYGFGRVEPVRIVRLLIGAWGLQFVTGAAFGVASILAYGALPDLQPIAKGALAVKIACAALALGSCVWLVPRGALQRRRSSWIWLALLGATAICAASFLRWFS